MTDRMPCSITDGPQYEEEPSGLIMEPTDEDWNDLRAEWQERLFDDSIIPTGVKPMILIGITGKAGAGKDTVGDILRIDHGFKTVSFAHPIKAAVAAILDVPIEKWEDRAWKETRHPMTGKTPRYMAQTLGTEWGRELICESLWVDIAFSHAASSSVAITDVRFENEAQRVREQGILIHVARNVTEKIDNTEHASEAGIKPYYNDYLLRNHGSLTDLRVETSKLINEINSRLERQSA